jgi:hypothetical protein
VERHELLVSGSLGWFVALTAMILGERLLRRVAKVDLLCEWDFGNPSYNVQASWVQERYPVGMKIGVRPDPEHPAVSVAEL